MAGYVLELRGCTTEPLGNYLKALGVFRLIAEQADPQARAWWSDGIFHVLQSRFVPVESVTAESKLVDWLLNECRYSPLIAPWQTGTGYLPIGTREAGGAALTRLLRAEHAGTLAFRNAFRDFAATLGIALSDDPSTWREAMKSADVPSDENILRTLRNRVESPSALRWLDAVGMSASRDQRSGSPWWFPLLASGGGEASGQYIVNYQQRLGAALLDDQPQSRRRLEASVVGTNSQGALEADAMGAMYYPSLMQVPNAGQRFLSDPKRRVNPWDFILLLEGSLVWAMSATRRKGVASERASFPFYCRSSFGGSMTIGPKEVEGAQGSISRGELWCPTWSKPSTLREIQQVFGEGRIQVDARACSRSLDFALAMTGFGVDRGLQAFHRYSLLERSGSGRQTTLLAVPSGCFVPEIRAGGTNLADLRGFAESMVTNLVDNGQRRLMLARMEFERAWFVATASMGSATTSRVSAPLDLLVATGRLMRELGAHSARPGVVKVRKGERTAERLIAPVGSLGVGWADITEHPDDSHEYRLARAVAGIAGWGEPTAADRRQWAVESLRANLLPLVRRGNVWVWDARTRSAVWSREAALEANLAAVLRRRLIDASRGTGNGQPLWSSSGAGFDDLLAFWRGEVDELRMTDFIHGLALIDTRGEPVESRRPVASTPGLHAAFELPRVYHLLKLCFIGGRMPGRPDAAGLVNRTGDEPFPPECLDVLTLLTAGRLAEAARLAARRLRAKGYPPILRETDLSETEMGIDQCRRMAGMLLIPVEEPGVCAALSIKPGSAN